MFISKINKNTNKYITPNGEGGVEVCKGRPMYLCPHIFSTVVVYISYMVWYKAAVA